MASVIEELYHGNIRPDAGMYLQDSPFVQAARVKHENLEKLMAAMDDSEKEIFEKYCDIASVKERGATILVAIPLSDLKLF